MSEEKNKIVEKKKITFSKDVLTPANKEKIEFRKKEVEVSELNSMMGLEKDEVAVMVVRQLEFSELIGVQQDQFDYLRNLIEGRESKHVLNKCNSCLKVESYDEPLSDMALQIKKNTEERMERIIKLTLKNKGIIK